MCGFLGQFNTPNLPESLFRKLLAMAVHRGPDQTGFWEGECVQLGFNRLSILELTSAGYQPMLSPNGRFVVIFNGEIYNHLNLREHLPKYNYVGRSDTETISFALEVWGIRKTVESLDGMFAIAIYDIHSSELTLVRDFAGIKPLFYGVEKNQIVFASQYDQVKCHPLFENKSINLQVLKLYLKQHFVPAPFGLHNGINQLHPGEMISFNSHGDIKKLRYWKLPEVNQRDLVTDEIEAQRIFSIAFEKSVKDQLIADVGVGAFLSGGVDSPLICAYAKKFNPGISVFTIGSDSKIHDESERASQYSKAMQLKQHLWQLSANEMQSYWDEATTALHEPFADFSILPTYLVSKLARQNVTVALSGDGGDELFFGYERFGSIAKNLSYQNLPGILRKGIYGIDKITTNNKNVNSLVTLKNQSNGHEVLHSRFSDKWLNKIVPGISEVELPDEWLVYNYQNSKDIRQLYSNMRVSEFYGMMQKTLRKVDLASMQNSLEVRVPFLQKEMIEAAFQIDPLLSAGANRKKEVLKLNLIKQFPFLLDDNVKRGFSIPLGNWIREGLYEKFESAFEELALKNNMFDEKAMKNLLVNHSKGQDLKWPLFTLYALSH